VPTCTVITEPFAFKSRREVEALGLAELPILVLPHPIGQLPREPMRRIAEASFAEVEFILTASAETVASAYRGAVGRPANLTPVE
jgi:predicted dienelactone hydrolase